MKRPSSKRAASEKKGRKSLIQTPCGCTTSDLTATGFSPVYALFLSPQGPLPESFSSSLLPQQVLFGRQSTSTHTLFAGMTWRNVQSTERHSNGSIFGVPFGAKARTYTCFATLPYTSATQVNFACLYKPTNLGRLKERRIVIPRDASDASPPRQNRSRKSMHIACAI